MVPLRRPFLALLGLAALAGAARAADVVTNFTTLGTFTTPKLTVGVLEITADDGTAPADVQLLNFNGLGVVGGSSSSMTDGSEALHFRFDAAVRDVKYTVFVANNLNANAFVGEATIEVFVGATSLGVFATHDTGFKDVSALVGNVPITGFDVRANVDGCRIDTVQYKTNWDKLGSALAGATGLPVLDGQGTLLPGDDVTLTLGNALPGSTTFFVIGFSALNAPFKGGTLVPAPVPPAGTFLALPVDGAGALPLVAPWPAGLPANTLVYFQHWILDGAGPAGFSASNALRARTP